MENSDNIFKEDDKWSMVIMKFLVIAYSIVILIQIGMWHGRNLERQEISDTNEMWNEMVACFQIKEMVKEQMYYDKQAARLKRGGTQ